MSRAGRVLDAAAGAALVAGWAWLLLAPAPRAAVELPPLQVRVDATGRRITEIDAAALDEAFAAAGLPSPPDLDGADPVPVEALLSAARDWIASGEAAALGRLGRTYQALEEHRAALGCFAAAAERDPGNPLWPYGLGAACQALGFDEQAIRALRAARDADPEYPTTHARLGTLWLRRGELEAAQRAWAEYVRLAPGASAGYVGLGRVALERGEPVRAEEYFRAAVARSPNDFRAHRFLAAAYAAGGEAEAARRARQRAERLPQYSGWLAFDPRLREAHAMAGTQRHLTNELRVAVGEGDFSRAADLAARLIERRPGDHDARGNLAGILRELGRLDEARAQVEAGLALKPDSAFLHRAAAEIAFTADDLAAAHAALDRALANDPRDAAAHDLRGRVYALQGRNDEAAAALLQALELDPGSIGTRLVLAVVRRAQGRVADAVAAVEEVLAQEPDHPRARQLLRELPGAGR